MNTNDILKKVDHTLLAQSATWEDIKVILDDGIKLDFQMDTVQLQ